MKNPVLACTAEAWGYGPASKLLTVSRMISGSRAAYVSGSARTFAELNGAEYDTIVDVGSSTKILEHTLEADHLLNVMDPCAALLAARQGVPTTYVDSLSWFWRWNVDEYEDLQREAARMLRMTTAQLMKHLEGVDWHRMVPLAYLWSDRVFVQRIGRPDPRLRAFGDRVRECGAIIDPKLTAVTRKTRAGLVSLSGGVSHVARLEHAQTYARFVSSVLAGVEGVSGLSEMLCHPGVASEDGEGGQISASLSHQELHAALMDASFILAPAGLTTALEAAAAGTAMAFLPEQHGGHLANAQLLDGGRGVYPGLLLSSQLGVTADDPAGFIEQLTHAYAKILESGPTSMAQLRERLQGVVAGFVENGGASQIAERQRRRVEELTGGFEGASTIAAAVGSAMGSRGVE
ncbi:hypothetical protein [Streptomyces sp. GZWMJZ-114]|uniref:hypothetical protein n=1 Tax=Streptomyces sp. GZWMJZ-114 TaxID=2494734 RepID=UPI0010100CA0|nr:hypothetical protein [Streptomyces sp. GZWMJZ-114]